MLYQFVCLPFGLKSAPYVFTKLLKPVFSSFRQKGIRCSYYVDDSLNMNQSWSICNDNTMFIVHTLQNLGFLVNEKKSSLVPSQRIVFFGFILDSVLFKVFLTDEKIDKIMSKANHLLTCQTVTVRELASFIGSVVNAFDAVLEAPLHYRDMERNKIAGLGPSMCFDNSVQLWPSAKVEIQWWLKNLKQKNGKPINLRK